MFNPFFQIYSAKRGIMMHYKYKFEVKFKNDICYNKINDIKKLEFLALAFYVTNSSKYLLFLSNYQ